MGDEARSTVDVLDEFHVDFDPNGDLLVHFSDDPSPERSMSPAAIRELERFLMEDGGDFLEVDQPLPDAFFSDLLFTSSDDGSVDDATPPENVEEEKSDEDVEPKEISVDQFNGEDSEDNRSKKRSRYE